MKARSHLAVSNLIRYCESSSEVGITRLSCLSSCPKSGSFQTHFFGTLHIQILVGCTRTLFPQKWINAMPTRFCFYWQAQAK